MIARDCLRLLSVAASLCALTTEAAAAAPPPKPRPAQPAGSKAPGAAVHAKSLPPSVEFGVMPTFGHVDLGGELYRDRRDSTFGMAGVVPSIGYRRGPLLVAGYVDLGLGLGDADDVAHLAVGALIRMAIDDPLYLQGRLLRDLWAVTDEIEYTGLGGGLDVVFRLVKDAPAHSPEIVLGADGSYLTTSRDLAGLSSAHGTAFRLTLGFRLSFSSRLGIEYEEPDAAGADGQ